VSDLLSGAGDDEVAAARGLPLAAVRGIRSFHELARGLRVCDGTACHFAGGPALLRRLEGAHPPPIPTVRCLGHCFEAPAAARDGLVIAGLDPAGDLSGLEDPAAWAAAAAGFSRTRPPVPRMCLAGAPVLLRNILVTGSRRFGEEYELPSGDEILGALESTGLRGRGGAAYPTAAKWRVARAAPGRDRYVVANGDEGDPGSFVDRVLLEEDPHAILAGMAACSRATGASRGIVYIRAEYPEAQRRMARAIDEARAAGFLGGGFDVEVYSGAGSFVCGEETALLRSIEGLRGEPRPKPPYPAEEGLFGLPTIVQNVETFAVVPWIARNRRGSGTKGVSISGAVSRPGLVEAPLGMPIRQVLTGGGGGPPRGRRWKMAVIGGPMGRILPERLFDTPLSFEALPGMGHAGIVVLDDTVSAGAVARHLFEFARAESCGSCAPCRIGTARLARMRDRGGLARLLSTMEMGSLCGFGQGVPRPIRDLLEHFPDEVLA
jgi:NADH:ubiquinone oxidoreductase subunit F (NADH-binding)